MTEPRTIVIAGSNGLIGQALATRLRNHSDRVKRLVRTAPQGPDEISWAPDLGQIPADALADADIVVNLAGAPIGTRRWTTSYRRKILRSRIRSTSLLAAQIADLDRPPVLLQASAIGIYGDRGREVLTEESTPAHGFLPDVVAAWEAATHPASEAGARVVLLRTGIVLSAEGGALDPLLRLLKLGLGGPLGTGRQFWSWITLADHIAALLHLMDCDVRGPVNLTAPNPATNRELTAALAQELRRPAFVRAPAFAIRAALGGFSSEILGSQYVLPSVLENSGFEFRHPDVTTAAQWVTHRLPH